jgi:hypothetical protein
MQLDQIKRREFITLLGGAAAWPLGARAQQREHARRIGVLLPAAADDTRYHTWVGAFLQGLALSGWSVGQNVRIDTRWATANADAVRRHAAELAASAPDVILAPGASTVGPLRQVTRWCCRPAALGSRRSRRQRGRQRPRCARKARADHQSQEGALAECRGAAGCQSVPARRREAVA